MEKTLMEEESEVTSSTATSAASCVLNTDSSSIKVFSIKILDNVFGITAIFKLCKPKTLLDRDVPYSSIALEKLFNVPLSSVIGQVAQVDLALGHPPDT